MKGKALFVVRAEVPEADRTAFDRWYAEEHLPDAVKAFGAARAWRGWSQVDPAVHFAFYEFPSLDRLRAGTGAATLQPLVAEFDRAWGSRVTRRREVIEIAESLPG